MLVLGPGFVSGLGLGHVVPLQRCAVAFELDFAIAGRAVEAD